MILQIVVVVPVAYYSTSTSISKFLFYFPDSTLLRKIASTPLFTPPTSWSYLTFWVFSILAIPSAKQFWSLHTLHFLPQFRQFLHPKLCVSKHNLHFKALISWSFCFDTLFLPCNQAISPSYCWLPSAKVSTPDQPIRLLCKRLLLHLMLIFVSFIRSESLLTSATIQPQRIGG